MLIAPGQFSGLTILPMSAPATFPRSSAVPSPPSTTTTTTTTFQHRSGTVTLPPPIASARPVLPSPPTPSTPAATIATVRGVSRWRVYSSRSFLARWFKCGLWGTMLVTANVAFAISCVAVRSDLDGTTQPGYLDRPVVVIDGSAAGAGVDGLSVTGGTATVHGLAVVSFAGDCFDVTGTGKLVLDKSYVGVTPSSVAAGNGGWGVRLETAGNKVGGTTHGTANVIGANAAGGVLVTGSAATKNGVTGNYIGTDVLAVADLGNGGAAGGPGVRIVAGASSNTVGATVTGADDIANAIGQGANLIAFKKGAGVEVLGGGAVTSGNKVVGQRDRRDRCRGREPDRLEHGVRGAGGRGGEQPDHVQRHLRERRRRHQTRQGRQ